jgi:hypothetical protein
VEGYGCEFRKLGFFLQNAWAVGGEAAVAPRGELRLAGADAGMTQAVDRRPWTRSIGPPWTAQGYKAPFNLDRPRRSDGPGRTRARPAGRRPARGGARRRGSPAMARSAIRAPNRAEITPGGRGEDEEAHQGLGGEGRAPVEEIERRLRRGPCCARGGSKRWSGAGGGGLEGALYGSEGEGEKAIEAVGGALRRRPLMAAVRGGGECRGGERVWEHGRVQRATTGALGCAFIGQGGEV